MPKRAALWRHAAVVSGGGVFRLKTLESPASAAKASPHAEEGASPRGFAADPSTSPSPRTKSQLGRRPHRVARSCPDQAPREPRRARCSDVVPVTSALPELQLSRCQRWKLSALRHMPANNTETGASRAAVPSGNARSQARHAARRRAGASGRLAPARPGRPARAARSSPPGAAGTGRRSGSGRRQF